MDTIQKLLELQSQSDEKMQVELEKIKKKQKEEDQVQGLKANPRKNIKDVVCVGRYTPSYALIHKRVKSASFMPVSKSKNYKKAQEIKK